MAENMAAAVGTHGEQDLLDANLDNLNFAPSKEEKAPEKDGNV